MIFVKLAKSNSCFENSETFVSAIIVRIYCKKGQKKLDKILSETNAHVKHFCLQKSVGFLGNKNEWVMSEWKEA